MESSACWAGFCGSSITLGRSRRRPPKYRMAPRNRPSSFTPLLYNLLMLAALLAASLSSPLLFAEGFESGTLDAWGDRRGKPEIVAEDPFEGKRCVKYVAEVGREKGAHLVRWFMPGEDRIAIKWAVKFAPDFDQGNHMHLCAIGGNRTDNKWSSMGKAGKKPNGTDFFVTNLEPWRDWGRNPVPGRLMFYSYWPDMQRSRDGNYWGNYLLSEPPLQVPRGKWVVLSLWIKLNTPGRADGEQAFWMDGKLGGRFQNIRFRDTDALKLNSFSLDLYVHDSRRRNVVWFDDVAISREPFAWMKL
jgi:hypothetical protein